jgi:hypothetical protein
MTSCSPSAEPSTLASLFSSTLELILAPDCGTTPRPMPNKARDSRYLSLALLVAWPVTMSAQLTTAMRASHSSSSCIDQLPPSAFTTVAVYAFVDLHDSVSSNFASTADNFLQDLVLEAQTLLVAAPGILPHGEPAIDWRGVDSTLRLTAFRDGRVVPGDTTSRTAAALMARALTKTSTVGLLDWTADSARDSIRFNIAFVRPWLDSAGRVSTPTARRIAIPLLSVRAPWERPVSQKPGRAHPQYPEGARRAWYEATIVLRFIVDSTGHAVDSTIKEVWPEGTPRLQGEKLSMYERFLESTKRTIPELELTPAMIGGCAVKQLVRMPFMFRLNR